LISSEDQNRVGDCLPACGVGDLGIGQMRQPGDTKEDTTGYPCPNDTSDHLETHSGSRVKGPESRRVLVERRFCFLPALPDKIVSAVLVREPYRPMAGQRVFLYFSRSITALQLLKIPLRAWRRPCAVRHFPNLIQATDTNG
jgi:hypothetical protein